MNLAASHLTILRECSRDEASFQRIIAVLAQAETDQANQVDSGASAPGEMPPTEEPYYEMEQFFNISLDMWCIADTDGYFRKLNTSWESTLGYTLDELEGRLFLELVHPDDLQPTLDAIATLDAQTPILNFTNRYRCKDGSYRYIEWRSQPQGKLIYAAARDITAHIEMQAALHQSETRLRSIFETIQDVIWSAELPDFKLTYVNPAAARIFGIPQEAFFEDDTGWRTLIHPEDYAMVLACVAQMIQQNSHEWEFRIMRPNGEVRWLHNHGWIVRDAQGAPLRTEGILSDITESKMLQQQEMGLKIKRERIQLLNDFITHTSHELRTPLTSIATSSYLMSRMDDPQKRREKADQIDQQIKALNGLIDELHEMSRLDELTSVNTTLIEMDDWITAFVREYPHVLIARPLAPSAKIAAEPQQLRLLLHHLIDNALRHAREDQPRVILQTRTECDEVVLDVEDHGTGIAPEHLTHVFDHFYKADASRGRDGSGAGMGLAIAKRVMELHGGSIAVESEVGTGTIFHLRFPLAKAT